MVSPTETKGMTYLGLMVAASSLNHKTLYFQLSRQSLTSKLQIFLAILYISALIKSNKLTRGIGACVSTVDTL